MVSTSVNEFAYDLNLQILPNPAHDQLTIQSSALIQSLELLDATSKVIFTNSKISEVNPTINLNGISPGIYLIKIIDQNKNTYSKRFIKE
jgi:hypothetical protein